jgi:uncharacterized membrane protein YfcA
VPGMTTAVSMIALGLTAGVLGGMFGIGGGLIMVPALVLIFGFDLKTATGTSLMAQLLPVSLLGVREYWLRNEVAVGSGLWIALGLLLGVGLGGRLVGLIPPVLMKRSYGVFLIVVGLYMLLASPSKLAPRRPGAAPAAPGPVTSSTERPSD